MNTLYREAKKWVHFATSGNKSIRATGQTAWLHSIVINTGAAGTITVFNNGDASGQSVAVITVASGDEGTIEYDVRLDGGLSLAISATMDITVIYE